MENKDFDLNEQLLSETQVENNGARSWSWFVSMTITSAISDFAGTEASPNCSMSSCKGAKC